MKTESQHFDKGRASFVIKSPGLGVLCQSRVILEFLVDVECPFHMSYDQAVQSVIGSQQRSSVVVAAATAIQTTCRMSACPKLVFSGGDAFSKGLSSTTITLNGASISNHNFNLYMRSLMDCWVSPEAYQARFSQCGGTPAQFDARPVSGFAVVPRAAYAAVTPIVAAWSGDSGVDIRSKNLMGCVESYQVPDNVLTRDKIRVRVQVPIWSCGLFNPFSPGDKISGSCPLNRSMVSLAHINNLTVEFLFDDLLENIFRDLGTQDPVAGGANNLTTGNQVGGYTVTLVADVKPSLNTVWLRLPSYRLIPEKIVASTFRITTHRESSKKDSGLVVIPASILRGGVALSDALPSVGTCRNVRGRSAQFSAVKYYESTFTAVQSAQPPQYLFFTFQKSSKLYTLDGYGTNRVDDWNYATGSDGAGTALDLQTTIQEGAGLENYLFARNADANAAIGEFELTVLSSVGCYTYSSEVFPYQKKRRQLWQDHLKNCVADYCGNDMQVWLKNKCCLLLHISDYIRGLSTENTAFPLQIDAKIKWVNMRDFVDGHCAASLNQIGPAFMQDVIQGTPIMAQIFTGGGIQITSSSASTSTANLSHSSATDILARRGG
jgi:hypothetical protein